MFLQSELSKEIDNLCYQTKQLKSKNSISSRDISPTLIYKNKFIIKTNDKKQLYLINIDHLTNV